MSEAINYALFAVAILAGFVDVVSFFFKILH